MIFSKYQNSNSLYKLDKNKWRFLRFSDVLVDETSKATKIKKEDYLVSGLFPIIDQGKEYIAGYTFNKEGLYSNSPIIIFGDHTRALKYINYPLYIGADGVKLLKNRFPEGEVITKYIYYYLCTVNIPDTGYNRHFKYLKEIVFPIPNVNIQKQIVAILEKAQELIIKRKVQIEALDQLTQSVFLDMFGDPINNPKGWKEVKINEVCDSIVPGRDKPKNFSGDIPWINIKDLVVGGVTKKSKENLGLTMEEIKEVKGKVIPKGSVLMSCVGDLGITSIAGKDLIINQQLHSYQCKESINNIFLCYLLPYKKIHMEKVSNSTTVLYMNKEKCNSIPIYLPPLQMQIHFAEIVRRIRSRKRLFEDSLVQLEYNYNSLLQRTFKGELFTEEKNSNQ